MRSTGGAVAAVVGHGFMMPNVLDRRKALRFSALRGLEGPVASAAEPDLPPGFEDELRRLSKLMDFDD